jgi:hypothetical protein
VNNNEICGIREKSIDNLSRLRVLSLRNNKVTMMQERAFRALKSNMMHLDVAGLILKLVNSHKCIHKVHCIVRKSSFLLVRINVAARMDGRSTTIAAKEPNARVT